LLRQTTFAIGKDIRRAGFCNGTCEGKSVIIGNAAGEAASSCILVIYDLNRNGKWDKPGTAESEYFGYRLRQGGIEIQRGAGDCSSAGWENFLDPAEVNVTRFEVTELAASGSGRLYSLQLEASWSNNPLIHRQVTEMIAGHVL